jgi:hypothetical protein
MGQPPQADAEMALAPCRVMGTIECPWECEMTGHVLR